MTKEKMVDFIINSGLVDGFSAAELMKENKSYVSGLFLGALMYQAKKSS